MLKRVESDDGARAVYLKQIATHTALQAILADCLPQRAGVPTAVDTETESTVVLKSKWPAAAAITSMAITTMLLVCGIGYFWIGSQNQPIAQSVETPVETPHVALITQAIGAYDNNVAIRSGQQVMSGKLSLDRGLIRLDFDNGASVAVEGLSLIHI